MIEMFLILIKSKNVIHAYMVLLGPPKLFIVINPASRNVHKSI